MRLYTLSPSKDEYHKKSKTQFSSEFQKLRIITVLSYGLGDLCLIFDTIYKTPTPLTPTVLSKLDKHISVTSHFYPFLVFPKSGTFH